MKNQPSIKEKMLLEGAKIYRSFQGKFDADPQLIVAKIYEAMERVKNDR